MKALNGVRRKGREYAVLIFYKIAEPRITRLIYLTIYGLLLVAGISTFTSPPLRFENAVGTTLVIILGLFTVLGAFLSFLAVLPGIWWLERSGLLAMMTAVAMYIALLFTLEASPFGLAISATLFLRFILRWLEIRPYQLAPRKD